MKIAILGESKRLSYLANKLIEQGHSISFYNNGSSLPDSFSEELIILPIPTFNKKGFLNLKDNSEVLPCDLLKRIPKLTLTISCNFFDENYNMVDINKREDFAYLNAIPTSEAAIVIAIKHLGATIYNTKCLICGFGRIGKMLALRLKSLNAYVGVSARNEKDQGLSEAMNFRLVKPCDLKLEFSNYDVVFQTVPYEILTDDLLSYQEKRPLIIELSSGCIGTDLSSAQKLGFEIVDATNLPERYTPNTAGSILYDITMKILEENNKTEGGL